MAPPKLGAGGLNRTVLNSIDYSSINLVKNRNIGLKISPNPQFLNPPFIFYENETALLGNSGGSNVVN